MTEQAVPKLAAHHPLMGAGDLTIGDFWSWAYSDVLSNRNRSIFAEFLVASALGATVDPRREWASYDVAYYGKLIEVKSAGYVQSWRQEKPSTIKFGIAPALFWYEETNTYEKVPSRCADCYVFCLFTEQDRLSADALNIDAWRFYVLPTAVLNKALPTAKSVGLPRLERLCAELETGPVPYPMLKAIIHRVLCIRNADNERP